MIKFDTLIRVFFSVAVYLLLSNTASAQSVLNFSRYSLQNNPQASISVTNPTAHYADIQFSMYGAEGNLVMAGVVNPVSYRIPPKGQLAMLASEMFAGSNIQGWIQARSVTSGLQGFYFSGEREDEGSEAVEAFNRQIVPYLRRDEQYTTDLVLVNPNSAAASFSVTFYTPRGAEAETIVGSMEPHAMAVLLPPISGTASARVDASLPVTASAVVTMARASVFVGGQSLDHRATLRIAPHFASAAGFNPVLMLTNPESASLTAVVTTFSGTGGAVHQSQTGPSRKEVTIPANGSVALDAVGLTGIAFPPMFTGWVQIESPNVALAGVVILAQAEGMTAVPLETAPSEAALYSQIVENGTVYTGLSIVNPSLETAEASLYLVDGSGRTIAQRTIAVPGNTSFLARMQEIVPSTATYGSGFVYLRSSRPVYSVGIRGSRQFLASMKKLEAATGYTPDPVFVRPIITRIDPGIEVRPGVSLRIVAENVVGSTTFLIGTRAASSRALFPGSPTFDVVVPDLEPGYVTLRMRNNGLEAEPVTLRILPPDGVPTHVITGQAFYQKIEVDDSGLDLSRFSMAPVRSARVEVIDRSSQAVVSVSETDLLGRFRVPVPFEPDLTVQLVSRLRTAELRVVHQPSNIAPYTISTDIDGRVPDTNVLIVDNTRVSGAFNILEVIQRGNEGLRMADPYVDAPELTIFWNTSTASRLTSFNVTGSFAYVAGDRTFDADEYDDSVILHEYAHLLAVHFSRDDSPGGAHGLGDILDPRVAWSEGWANFFSSFVRNDPIYRDARGPDGASLLRYDLEDNNPSGNIPGFSSEASIHSLLWDLFDDREDAADSVQFSIRLIWSAFTDLRNDSFVYLPYFLERFLARSPDSANILREMVQSRSIDFQPGVRPSVTNPFPRIINVGEAILGEVDSLTQRRNNLMNSAHLLVFTTAGGAVSIRLVITGTGAGNNPAANDLDLFLMDTNGRVIFRSDRGLNGQTELISIPNLPPGSYVIEVRSFYTNAETNGLVYNSGQYRLTVTVQ